MKQILVLLFFPLFALAQKKEQFVINGNIKGLADSTFIVFAKPGESNEILATSYAKNGRFTLFGKVDGPDIYQLMIMGKPDAFDLFAGNEIITITGDVKQLDKAIVAGSVYHKDFQLYQLRFNSLKNSLSSVVAALNKAEEGPQKEALMNKLEATKKQVAVQVDRFIKERPSSPVSSFLVYVTSPIEGDIAAIETRYNSLNAKAKQGFYSTEIEKMITASRIGSIGTQAIDFVQNDTANIPVSLSSFKGKYVLVDFWASWCGPCRMENPNIVAAYQQYKDKNFTILGVSLDQVRDKWLNAIKADRLTWTHVSDLKFWQNEAAQLYRISSIPANMLLDPNGKIIAKDLRGEALHQRLNELLN